MKNEKLLGFSFYINIGNFEAFFLEFKLERKSFILEVCCLIPNQSKKILHFKMSYTLKCKIRNVRVQRHVILILRSACPAKKLVSVTYKSMIILLHIIEIES